MNPYCVIGGELLLRFYGIIEQNKVSGGRNMYLFFGLILLLPLLALKPRTDTDGSILDTKSTTCIKGILCIYVMLHNLGLDLDNGVFKELVCEHAGGIGVGLFFFLSAYGIIRSYQFQGNKYLRKLLLVNIPKLWLTAVFINVITYFSFFRGTFEPTDMWLRILNLDLLNGFNRMNRHGWYIASIIALYIVFAGVYFACSKLKTKNKFYIACWVMAFVAIGARLLARICDNGGMYTREMPAFALGCLYATYYDRINFFASKHFKTGLILSVIAFTIGFVLFEPVATYSAAIIIVLVSQKYTYYNKTTFFLGKICLGVYLFLHYSTLVLNSFLHNEYLWVLTNAGFILEIAVAIYGVQYAVDYGICHLKSNGNK
jgi:peptidoglycan/LPS O-acetylase OafA/YrhL